MNGESEQVAPPVTATSGWLQCFPHEIRWPGSVPGFAPATTCSGFPRPPRSSCTGRSGLRGQPFDAITTTRPSPRCRAGRCRHPAIHYRPHSRPHSGNLPKLVGCSNPTPRPIGGDAVGVTVDIDRATRKAQHRRSDPFPNGSRATMVCLGSRAVYMPAEGATGKGKIYNPPGNVGSGSRSSGPAGKMCKRGGIRS